MENMELLTSGIGCVISLLFLAIFVFVWWKILEKTGHSPWMSLLMLIPLANLILILFVAFSDWPVLKRLRELEARSGQGGQA